MSTSMIISTTYLVNWSMNPRTVDSSAFPRKPIAFICDEPGSFLSYWKELIGPAYRATPGQARSDSVE